MEDKKIEAVKNCPELKSVQNLQIFLGFTNFYWRFIHGFSKIAGPFISMLKIANNLLENLVAPMSVAEENRVVGGSASSRNLKKSKIWLSLKILQNCLSPKMQVLILEL